MALAHGPVCCTPAPPRPHGAAWRERERHASDHIFDTKTIHGGGPAYLSARARQDGQCGGVAQRAHQVHREYERHAERLDGRADVQAHNRGSTDAVQTVLRSYGTVRSLVWGQYGEASLDVHELFELVVDEATHNTWRFLGARCMGDARSYYATRLRRSWGILAVREMARHRLRRVCYVGAGHRPRGVQARGRPADEWEARSPSDFWAHSVRRLGAFAGLSARRGAPRRA